MAPKKAAKRGKAAASKRKNTRNITKTEAGGSSPWTTDHHLVGKTTTRGFLVPTTLDAHNDNTAYIPSTEAVQATFFQADSPQERKPALWRGFMSRSDRSHALAIDSVSSDWQQHQNRNNNNSQEQQEQAKEKGGEKNAEITSTILVPTKHIQAVVTDRLQGLILDRIYDDILPDLILKAALEELRTQFWKQQQQSNEKRGSSSVNTPPMYYSRHPNSYMTPPESPNEREPTTALVVQFTPSQLVTRIKQGCHLAWASLQQNGTATQSTTGATSAATASERRVSSRLARTPKEPPIPESRTNKNGKHESWDSNHGNNEKKDERYFWNVIPGGTIAAYLLDNVRKPRNPEATDEKNDDFAVQEDGKPSALKRGKKAKKGETSGERKEEQETAAEPEMTALHNPYLNASDDAVLCWLGVKTSKLLSASDLQNVFPTLVMQPPRKSKKKTTAASKKGADTKEDSAAPAVVGRTVSHLLTSIDRKVWTKLVSALPEEGVEARLVLELSLGQHQDDASVSSDLKEWEVSQFNRSHFSLRVVTDYNDPKKKGSNHKKSANDDYQRIQNDFKERKTWESARYKAIHSGSTLWPSWENAVLKWRQENSDATTAAGMDHSNNLDENENDDMQVAQALASAEQEETIQRSRRTRRGGDTTGVFYGNQSGMNLRQLLEALLRIVSQKPFGTMPELLEKVPDESNDPTRRMRNALGRLIWKRKQMSRLVVDTQWTDAPLWGKIRSKQLLSSTGQLPEKEAQDMSELLEYIGELNQTELQLRALVLDNLKRIPATLVSSAADERPGAMDSADHEVFHQKPSEIDWGTSGHEYLDKDIFRPPVEYNLNHNATCQWFRIVAFAPAIASDPDNDDGGEKAQIGSAKDNRAVERRARFKAVPTEEVEYEEYSTTLILTEAQVVAGLKAAEVQGVDENDDSEQEDHPFVGARGSKISLIPVSDDDSSRNQMHCSVVGWDSVCDDEGHVQHSILVLPETGQERHEAFRVLLGESETGGLGGTIEGSSETFTVQQFDFDESSDAFRECRAMIGHMQRHSKASPFLLPVDPVALNIPSYFDVIKHPMDIQTLGEKLERGEYSNIHPRNAKGRTPVAKMLNGPFRKDVELIFDNAIAFNPPDDWIYQAALMMKKYILKKIDQVSATADETTLGRRRKNTERVKYVEYDSDVDMYVYESDKDDDYDDSLFTKKRKRPAGSPAGEDTASRAIERPIKLQKLLGDASQPLKGPLTNLPVSTTPTTYSLPSDWNCQRIGSGVLNGTLNRDRKRVAAEPADDLSDLMALRAQIDEKEVAGLRRSTRAYMDEDGDTAVGQSSSSDVEYIHHLLGKLGDDNGVDAPRNRAEVEVIRERLHEEYFAKVFHKHFQHIQASSDGDGGTEPLSGLFGEGSFPPFLGRVTPAASPSYKGDVMWEIRTPNIIPAVRWVLRGLILSGHLKELEPMTADSVHSGVVIPVNAYYVDPHSEPFDVLHQKEINRRKRAQEEPESEEEVELSEYEKRRAERVARNADRLKSLGLA